MEEEAEKVEEEEEGAVSGGRVSERDKPAHDLSGTGARALAAKVVVEL